MAFAPLLSLFVVLAGVSTTIETASAIECPLDYSVLLPHEKDCSKFYFCQDGVKVEHECPGNLEFNPSSQVCVSAAKSGCVLTDDSDEDSKSNEDSDNSNSQEDDDDSKNDDDDDSKNDDDDSKSDDNDDDDDDTKEHDSSEESTTNAPTTTTERLPTTRTPATTTAKAPPVTTTQDTNPPTKPTSKPPGDKDPDCPWPDPLDHTVHLPHEDDCTKFYKCDHGQKVEFDCPDGLHFNTVLEVCDWPEAAGCESRNATTKAPITTTKAPVTTTKGPSPPTKPSVRPPDNLDPECPWPDPLDHTVHLPHEDDCTKFYKCDNGQKVEFVCPDGLHFNAVLEVCDWPRDAGCESTTKAPITTTKAPVTTTKAPVTTTKGPSPPTKPTPKPPGNLDPDCPWPDPLDHTVHLPHEDDCTKFYKCDNGQKVEFDCPDGLHFNPVLEVCDWPRDAGCESTTKAPITTTKAPVTTTKAPVTTTKAPVTTTKAPVTTTKAPATTTKGPSPPTKPTPKPPGDLDPDCPWPDPLDHTVHLPHEDDCTKFYKCDNGHKVEFDCPDGLHFNPVLEVCDWPRDAGCESTTKAPITTTKAPITTTKAPATTTKAPVTTTKPPVTTTKAPATTTKAPVTTTKGPSPPTKPTPKPPGDLDPDCPWPDPLDHTVHLPHEDDCTKFYKCDNGQKVEFDCPDGLHFNPVLEVCDWPQDAGCESGNSTTKAPATTTKAPVTTTKAPVTTTKGPSPPTKPTPKPPGDVDPECPWPDPLDHTVHLPHEDDCTKFYKCDNGQKVEFDCPDGLHFNPVLEVCDWPQDAGCESGNSTTKAPITTTKAPVTTTKAPVTTTKGPSPPTKPTPKPPGDLDPECPWPDPLDHTVHLPHEDDCTKFYKCDHGQKVEFDCPDGLHFNPVLEVCDWPSNAGCESNNTTDIPVTPHPEVCTGNSTLPHECDCDKYYVCENGEMVLYDCPKGLHFNEETERCDWPWSANCKNITTTTPKVPTTTTPKVTTTTTPEITTTTTPKVTTITTSKVTTTTTPEITTTTPKVTTTTTPEITTTTTPKVTTTTTTKLTTTTTPEITTTTPKVTTTTTPKVTTTTPEITTTTTSKVTTTTTPEITTTTTPKVTTTTTPKVTTTTTPEITTTTPKVTTTTTPKVTTTTTPEITTTTTPKVTTTTTPKVTTTTTPEITTTTPPPVTDCPAIDCDDTTRYLPVYSDPRKYIRCDHGVEVLETCPPNLVFDKKIAMCNLESQIQY